MNQALSYKIVQLGRNRTVALGLTCLLAAVIAAATLTPQTALTTGPAGVDKVYHAVAFAGLMLPTATWRPNALIWMIPAALLFGGTIEVIQPLVGRSADIGDFIADAVGVLAGTAVGFTLRRGLMRSST